MRPISITARPPILPTNPIVSPATSALLSGIASWAATTVTEKLDNKAAPAKAKKIVLKAPQLK